MAFATMEGSVTRTYKERCAEAAGGFLDGIDKIDRIAETDTPNASNPVNPVKDPPRLPASNNSALSDSNLTLSSVTNPCFYGIERGTDTVTLGVAWPDGLSLPNGRLDVFGHWQLASGGWTRLAQVDVSGAQSPAAVEIGIDSFQTNAMERAAFFRLATQDDSDGDGLSDAYEAWTLGTGPANPDTDGDGLGDGDEVALGTDPLGADTDGDGLADGVETGCIVRTDAFEWYDTSGWATVYGTSYGEGLHSYWGALAIASLPDGLTVLGSLMSKAVCFDNGVMYLDAPGSNVALVFPELATPLDRGTYSMGDILVAPYWCSTALVDGDASSCMRTGIVESNGCFVVEYRNVRLRGTSDDRRMTYQVIVPGGTGSVVRVSYLASDVWLDGSDAVVGVQVRRIVTPDGLYNLTWDFAERGPILPGTTVEYRLGHGSDPLRADTDGDGLSDGQEVNVYGTSPTNPDTDGDGLKDGAEISRRTDPFRSDTDYDGLNDGFELLLGTDPRQPDTDGDGLTDGWEDESGYDPTVDNNTDADPDNDADADPDGDGLTNGEENDWGTNPNQSDTDGDGVSDGAEALGASDPLDASDVGRPGSCRPVRLEFGDPSGSSSEKYSLAVIPVTGSGNGPLPRSHVFLNREYGECETKTAALKPGWRYEVKLRWAACKNSGEGYPDYDYRLLLVDTDQTSGVFLDDPKGLFVTDDNTSTRFSGESKAAYLDVVKLVVRSDRIMPYDVCQDGELIDSRTATVRVEPCVTGSALTIRNFELLCRPVGSGTLVNDNHGTTVTTEKTGTHIWRTSPIYWYGVLPDRDCAKYHHEYAFDLRENGLTVLSRKCPVGWPESNAHSLVLPPTGNDTHRGEAKFYHSTSEDYWYCEIVFKPFQFEEGSIYTEPDGQNFTWTGQYADKVRAEEEFHIKQVRGEVPTSQGGQGDCYTIKGLKYFVSQQAISNQNVVTSTWIVKGETRQDAEDNADAVIARAVNQELAESLRIRFEDRGFMEYSVKRHLNYNAAYRYHCSYEEAYGSNPINHVHPAYVKEGEQP